MTSFRKRQFLFLTFLRWLFKDAAVELVEVSELSELEESNFALTQWIHAGLSVEDAGRFISSAFEGRAVRGLRMLEGAARFGGGVPLASCVLIHIDWHDLIEKAVECGMAPCPGAIRLLRLMNQPDVDALLNRLVAVQMRSNPDRALQNVEVMMALSVRLTREIADAMPDSVRDMLWVSKPS